MNGPQFVEFEFDMSGESPRKIASLSCSRCI